ncbi:MAG TPA: hypothetical protein VM390_00235 [Acidimicrobiales bacterium]|nr:hypothetical protein [Acidimicrobiales bacterium]
MGERPSIAAIAAAVVAAVMLVVYLVIAASEGDNPWAGVGLFAAILTVAAVSAAVGALLPYGARRTALLSVAALLLVGVGVLGIFTIGLPLLVAGLCAFGAAAFSAGRGSG